MRKDAVKALVGGYTEIRQALCTTADDADEVDKTKNEAEGLISRMDELETCNSLPSVGTYTTAFQHHEHFSAESYTGP